MSTIWKVFIGLVVISTATGYNVNITSPPITDWGLWGKMERCPYGCHAHAFQLKTERNQLTGDDTSLNALRLFCGDPFKPDTPVITSTQGLFGKWGSVHTCFPGELNGFQLRSESNRGSGDDTATNNIRFFCSSLEQDSSSSSVFLQGDGKNWGEWTDDQKCFRGQGICAIQTQVEPYLADNGDDTMLNNVRFQCCDKLTPEEAAVAACEQPPEKIPTVGDLHIFPVEVVHRDKLRLGWVKPIQIAAAEAKD